MARNIDDIISELPKRRRDRINAKAEALALQMLGEADSVASIRKAFGLTQAEFGDLIGMPQNAVSQLEKRRDIYLSTLGKVANALTMELEVALRAPDGTRVELPNFHPWTQMPVTTSAAAKKVVARTRRELAPYVSPSAVKSPGTIKKKSSASTKPGRSHSLT
ncbi:MAG: helix-turn-helix transcriptional regulator [Pseudomonadota bacterium]